MLNDLLEELGIDTETDFEQFEKSDQLASDLEIIAKYFPDCPSDFQESLQNVIKLGLNLK